MIDHCYAVEYVSCNLCGNADDQLMLERDGFQVVRCRRCGLWYVNPQNTRERLSKIYDDEYFQSDRAYYKDYYADREWRTKEFEKLVKKIEPYQKGGRLLDVGAAAGYLLDSARGRGWETYGVEYSKTASQFARQELNLNVQTGELRDMHFEDGSFNVITMVDVIEHMKDPKEDLRRAAKLLKKGGLLYLSTPNIGSWGFKIFGKGFVFMRPEVHLWYFDPKTISDMLTSVGFRVLKIDYPYFGTPFFNIHETVNLIRQIVKKMILGNRQIVPSAPMRGNLMNLFCVKSDL